MKISSGSDDDACSNKSHEPPFCSGNGWANSTPMKINNNVAAGDNSLHHRDNDKSLSRTGSRERESLQTFYSWTPSAVTLVRRTIGEYLSSPVFSHDGLKWRVGLYPRGVDADSQDYFSLFLEHIFDNTQGNEIQANFAFYIRNADGKHTHRQASKHLFTNSRPTAGICKYLKRKDLVDGFTGILCHVQVEKISELNYNLSGESCNPMFETGQNKFNSVEYTLLPHTLCYDQVDNNNVDEMPLEPSADFRVGVATHLQRLLYQKMFSDVILVIANKKFFGHKAILASRSQTFYSIFVNDEEVKRTNTVNIAGINVDVFREILRFIYTGIADVKNKIVELYFAADKYALTDLKSACEKTLGEDLNVENAANILILADHYKADELKEKAISFINENAPQVIRTAGYKLLVDSYLHLIEQLYYCKHTC